MTVLGVPSNHTSKSRIITTPSSTPAAVDAPRSIDTDLQVSYNISQNPRQVMKEVRLSWKNLSCCDLVVPFCCHFCWKSPENYHDWLEHPPWMNDVVFPIEKWGCSTCHVSLQGCTPAKISHGTWIHVFFFPLKERTCPDKTVFFFQTNLAFPTMGGKRCIVCSCPKNHWTLL